MSPPEPIRTKPARSAPPPVRRFAAGVFADLAVRTKYVDPAIAGAWETIAGPEIASLCRPGRLTGGGLGRTLEVVVRDGAAAARVQVEAESLRRKINGFLGPNAVGRIALRQGARASEGTAGGALGSALGRFRASVRDKGGSGA